MNEEARKRNGSLPGMGGVYNIVNLHLYHYAANNPVKYIDPNGEDIELYGTPEEQAKMLDLINNYSYKQYAIDDNGKLYATNETIDGRSKEYSNYLDQGIKNDRTRSIVFLAPEGGYKRGENDFVDLNSHGGGHTDYLINNETGEVYRNHIVTGITGKPGYDSTLGEVPAEDVMMHELMTHSIPIGLGGMDDANAIKIDNKARKELGLQLRRPDPMHTVLKH